MIEIKIKYKNFELNVDRILLIKIESVKIGLKMKQNILLTKDILKM